MEMVPTARTGAGALTSEKVDHLLTRPMRADLDRLLVHDPEIGATQLAWLTTPTVEATPTSIKLAKEVPGLHTKDIRDFFLNHIKYDHRVATR